MNFCFPFSSNLVPPFSYDKRDLILEDSLKWDLVEADREQRHRLIEQGRKAWAPLALFAWALKVGTSVYKNYGAQIRPKVGLQ